MKTLITAASILLNCLFVFAELPDEIEEARENPPTSPAHFHELESQRYARIFESARDRETNLDDHPEYDIKYYDLFFDVRNFLGSVLYANGRVIAQVESGPLTTWTLDLCYDLSVDSVIVAGLPRAFSRTPQHELRITLDRAYNTGELVETRIYYHGNPCATDGLNSWQWYTRTVSGSPIYAVHTLSEPEGSRDWWPNKNFPYDKADSARISILCSDTLTGTSNGELESVTNVAPNSKLYVWQVRNPISSYLITINVTNYTHFPDWYVALNGDSVPIDHYPYPERHAQAVESWNVLPDMMEFLASKFGEYPFANEKYGHTMFNFGGAMEHQCNTSYGRSITNGAHTYDYIVVHEAAHQWWGDCVSPEAWPDIWLNEGFAAYCEALWWEHVAGFDSLSGYMTSYLGNEVVDPSGPVYNPADLFSSNNVYDKGAWILHILRGVIRNDSVFFAIFAEYRSRHEYGAANTAEFLDAASDVAGFDVLPYVSPYLYETDRPSYTRSYGTGLVDGVLRTVVRINQIQVAPVPLFQTKLDIKFTGGGSPTYTVENSLAREKHFFDLGFTPTGVTIDPDDWVLKYVTNVSLPSTILNTALSAGVVGQPYADTMVVVVGSGTPTWTLIAGVLPVGVSMGVNGILSGSPTESGNFPVSIRVSRSPGGADTSAFVISVLPPLTTPEFLTITAISDQVVRLDWSESPEATSYNVWRATSADMSDRLLIATTLAETHTDSTATVNATTPLAIRFYEVTSVR